MTKLVHAKRDTWTSPDGVVFFDEKQAMRYITHGQLAEKIRARYALSDAEQMLPQMSVNVLAELILSLTFDEQFNVVVPEADASSELVMR
jgi:hypothetical protein